MCGLTGFIDASGGFNEQDARTLIGRMTDTIRHRGPDDEGMWLDPSVGVAFGFRRLSIVDLSEHGHQPMESTNGRFVIVFNGEIYNFAKIRQEIAFHAPEIAHKIRGHSDTAVMLAAFEYWGIEISLKKFVGMFAMAVLDRHERLLILCRDRMGEKPLYYGWTQNGFFFGSELKSLKQHPEFTADLDPEAIQLYMLRTFIPAPHTIYKNVKKLLSGTMLVVPLADLKSTMEPVAYWSVEEAAKNGLAHQFDGTDEEAVNELEGILGASVRGQMVADVPLGAFLSGGIDSSLVVALMQAANSNPVKTFSIGFESGRLNEAPHAKAVAKHLGTDHVEMYVTETDARDVIPLLPTIYDEPFADSSQIPTYLVSNLARAQVTVSLTGDGGDELFGGYNSYLGITNAWGRIEQVPFSVRKSAGTLLDFMPDKVISALLPWGLKALRSPLAIDTVAPRVPMIAQSLRSSSGPLPLYTSMITRKTVPLTPNWFKAGLSLQARYPQLNDHRELTLEHLLYFDQVGALTDDMMTKVDRASMATSLETRAPFLDHRLVDWSWRLPTGLKIRDGRGKWILRELLDRYVPRELVDRPKQGFGIPVGDWLRGPLKSWAEDLIDPKLISSYGILDPEAVGDEWKKVHHSSSHLAPGMWSILMFQSWLELQR